MTYRVNEIFYSLQGEGFYTGTPAVFVRLSGCNRRCPFCDTDFDSFTEMSVADIMAEIGKYPARHVVITGGEPTLQLEDSFLTALKTKDYYIQIETNGSRPVPSLVDWVTCSPKDRPWRIDRVDELKIVYTGQDVEEIAAQFPATMGVKVYCLQPCSGANIPETIDYILHHPRWRLSLQTHKLLNIQ